MSRSTVLNTVLNGLINFPHSIMKQFVVYITESNSGEITVEAKNAESAITIANEQLENVKWFRSDITHMTAEEIK